VSDKLTVLKHGRVTRGENQEKLRDVLACACRNSTARTTAYNRHSAWTEVPKAVAVRAPGLSMDDIILAESTLEELPGDLILAYFGWFLHWDISSDLPLHRFAAYRLPYQWPFGFPLLTLSFLFFLPGLSLKVLIPSYTHTALTTYFNHLTHLPIVLSCLHPPAVVSCGTLRYALISSLCLGAIWIFSLYP
jgi:hypothetical protein